MGQATLDRLAKQEEVLVFQNFDENTAFELGSLLRKAALAISAPVIIEIRDPSRMLFVSMLPGATPDNAVWARRKSNVVLRFHRASLAVGLNLKLKGREVSAEIGLNQMDHAVHGGSFPIRVRGAGVIGAISVSGLASETDHGLIVDVLSKYLGVSLP